MSGSVPPLLAPGHLCWDLGSVPGRKLHVSRPFGSRACSVVSLASFSGSLRTSLIPLRGLSVNGVQDFDWGKSYMTDIFFP